MIWQPKQILIILALCCITVLIFAYLHLGGTEKPFVLNENPPEVTHRMSISIEGEDTLFEAAYLSLHRSGELAARAEKLWNKMQSCTLCPRRCGAARLQGAVGFCSAIGNSMHIASAQAHFGEEAPLVGRGGSGTIFFSNCNLKCVFCQNWDISHRGRGRSASVEDLASMMLDLQRRGCHNINLVTPTHYSAHILKAIDLAAEQGLRIPIVYNTSGWERVEILQYFDGVIDIYLPDMKYTDNSMAIKYSAGAHNYVEKTKAAILEMQRQVGTAKVADDGILYTGLIIRHLVMPENVSGSVDLMNWIAAELPADTYVNIMSQYRPEYRAYEFEEISRRITEAEYLTVVNHAKELGLTQLDYRGFWWMY